MRASRLPPHDQSFPPTGYRRIGSGCKNRAIIARRTDRPGRRAGILADIDKALIEEVVVLIGHLRRVDRGLRLAHLVRHASRHYSTMDPRLDTGGWLALTQPPLGNYSRQGLSSYKIYRALLGAITLRAGARINLYFWASRYPSSKA